MVRVRGHGDTGVSLQGYPVQLVVRVQGRDQGNKGGYGYGYRCKASHWGYGIRVQYKWLLDCEAFSKNPTTASNHVYLPQLYGTCLQRSIYIPCLLAWKEVKCYSQNQALRRTKKPWDQLHISGFLLLLLLRLRLPLLLPLRPFLLRRASITAQRPNHHNSRHRTHFSARNQLLFAFISTMWVLNIMHTLATLYAFIAL